MPNHGDGPIQYIETLPCSPTNPQVTLSVPPLVLQSLTEEQRMRIARIQIDFAQRVSRALQRSYNDIAVVLGRDPRKPREGEEPKE